MIRFLLLAGQAWTDRHQGAVLAGVALCFVLAGMVP